MPNLRLSVDFPVFIVRKLNSSSVPKTSHHSISYRSFKPFHETEFINNLSTAHRDVIKMFDAIILLKAGQVYFVTFLIEFTFETASC